MSLFYGSQKVCPVIKVIEEVSSGYTFTINLSGGNSTLSWTINGDTINTANLNSFSIGTDSIVLTYPCVETITFSGVISGSYTYGTIYINGTAYNLESDVTYTLESNNDYANITIASCLTGDTLITMADGTKVRIDSLKVGDKVLSINPETGEKDIDEIKYSDSNEEKYSESYDIWAFNDGTEIKTVKRHRFYNINKKEFTYMDEWNIGDYGINIKGDKVALINHKEVKEKVKHYTLFTEKWNNYFANDMLSGNRYSSQFKREM